MGNYEPPLNLMVAWAGNHITHVDELQLNEELIFFILFSLFSEQLVSSLDNHYWELKMRASTCLCTSVTFHQTHLNAAGSPDMKAFFLCYFCNFCCRGVSVRDEEEQTLAHLPVESGGFSLPEPSTLFITNLPESYPPPQLSQLQPGLCDLLPVSFDTVLVGFDVSINSNGPRTEP